MRIRQLTASIVRLPLKRKFSHASASRDSSENVLICCELENGASGWGEGVPRDYVTGETPAGCLAQLGATAIADQLTLDCNAWPDVAAMCDRFALAPMNDNPRGCYGNALRCAIELSILDAFGQMLGEPLSAVTNHYAPARPIARSSPSVRYSVVIDAGHTKLRRKSLARRIYGFRSCKVKVGAPGDDDRARLRTIRHWAGWKIDLRVDANEAWRASEARDRFAAIAGFGISCVEQPLPHAEIGALAELRRQVVLPIMLDESLTSEVDARNAIDQRLCDLFNIRLSKCGGFLASLRLAALARSAGLGYQLGCHPGETGILSAAGRHWATSVDDIRYLEGSYDRFLFSQLLTNEDITFGYGGRAPALARPGLGVTVNQAALREVTLNEQVFSFL